MDTAKLQEWADMAERATNPAVLLTAAREAYMAGAMDHYIVLVDRTRQVSDYGTDQYVAIGAWERIMRAEAS